MAYLIVGWIVLHVALFIVSLKKIRGSKQNIAFIYQWAMVFGAFVWEDLIIFSALNIVGSLLVFVLRIYESDECSLACFG